MMHPPCSQTTIPGHGAHHSGVAFAPAHVGPEYFTPFELAFGGGDWEGPGVWVQTPQQLPESFAGAVWKECVDMGECELTKGELDDIIHNCRTGWAARSYHLLRRNCNHFASELCDLLVGKSIPSYVNQLAGTGANLADNVSLRSSSSCFKFSMPGLVLRLGGEGT
jgi:hypothetical protein